VAVLALAAAANEGQKAIRRLAYEQEDHARKLKEFSGMMAFHIARLDAERTFRSVETADKTAKTAGDLTRAIDRWERATQPWEQAAEKLKNTLGAGALDALTKVLGLLEPAIDRLNDLLDKITGTPPTTQGDLFGDWARKMYEDHERKQRDARAKMDRNRLRGSG
jgi:hypothetical protein